MEKEGKRVEIKTMCVSRVSSDLFEDFSSMAEWESDRDYFRFLVCVLAVSSFVTVVLVVPSPSNVTVFGEIVFSDSDCEFVESQTFSSLQKA